VPPLAGLLLAFRSRCPGPDTRTRRHESGRTERPRLACSGFSPPEAGRTGRRHQTP
jgi:hypothetical protein